MKKFAPLFALTAVIACVTTTRAAIITVNTEDNTDFSPGKTNLVTAINSLNAGDTINFNIPGSGPHYLLSPGGGYPMITNKNNITIDGYSQPGSAPNTNSILASNNAQIKIVLDARNGEFSTLPNDIPGYGTSEVAILFVLGSTNFTVRGICFLGSWDAVNSTTDQYAVAFGGDQPSDNGHVSGCRFGLDLDGATVARLKDCVTAFGSGPNNGIVVGVASGPANAAAARAQFNVMIAAQIPVIIEGNGTRISGNFFNVFPDGLHDFNVDGGVSNPTHTVEAFIEIGSYGNNVVIGTDGDGLNDAEERNIFGGVTDADDHRILEWYGGTRTNTIVAGNYFGVGVDGGTRFTNGGPTMEVIEGFNSTTTVRVGSDFDGVSDDIEANVISWNYPFTVLYPDPAGSVNPNPDGRWRFAKLDSGARVSLRGNKMMGNLLAPYMYAYNDSSLLAAFTNYAAPYMSTNADIVPILSTNSTWPRLAGTCAVGIDPYTNIIIDVYRLDPEGWENGKLFGLQELIAPDGTTNGFPQGRKYLGSFVDNGPQDSDPAVGKFSLNLSGLDLGTGAVTVTANYSADPPKTRNGRIHTSNFSNPITLIPGGTGSVGLTNIVPDVLLWYNSVGNYYTNGPVDPSVQLGNAAPGVGNWEPYISVLGDSTFLIGANTYADDQTPPAGADITQGPPFQRFVVTFQPMAGGAPKIGEEFFTDTGSPYRGVISYSRQNGNPQRVAGDKRIGATNFLTAAETSAGQNPAFQSDSRWTSNLIYQADNRYVTVQPFSLDTATLVQTPLHKAFDAVYGNYVDNSTAPGGGNQISRTGGTVAALDNGNFLVVWDDKTTFSDPAPEVTTFGIITPTGTVVKTNTLVDPRAIWDNVCAYHGGFAVRVQDTIYFYDNNGNLQGSSPQDSSGLSFDKGRGDGTRIASDIRSYYVYLAGNAGAHTPVSVAIWDSRTRKFVASAPVSDTDPSIHIASRVVVAVDASDRFCVAYGLQPSGNFSQEQTAVRVMSFDGTNITYLTHSFFPFVNYDPDGSLGLTTVTPSVAMTTRQICIAAKGTINSTNNPAGGPNTATETTLYTVINHPDPQNYPGYPVEYGRTVNGFQDDFTGATRDPNWKAIGPGGDHYVQEDGVLKVYVATNDPNHLIYQAPGYSNTVQEVLARMRVVAFSTNSDAPRGGIAVGVMTNAANLSRGINLEFRDYLQDANEAAGQKQRKVKFLNDLVAWGPAGLPLQWANNTWYWLRLRQEPNAGGGTNRIDVFGKVWPADGVTPEPYAWQMTWDYAPAVAVRQGFAGITGCSGGGLAHLEVDYILIKADGLPSTTVGFALTGPPPNLPKFWSIVHSGANVVVDYFGGLLQSANIVTGPYTNILNAVSPRSVPVSSGQQQFYRVAQ